MRWSSIVVMVLVPVLAGCGGAEARQAGPAAPSPERLGRPSAPPPSEPATVPSTVPPAAPSTVPTTAALAAGVTAAADGRPVAMWLHVGGLAASGLVAVRPPSLVVYADGRAIADATHELRLPPAEVETLVKELGRELAGQPATASPRPGTPTVYDAPATVLGVDSGGGMREVHVPHLDMTRDAYAPALAGADDRLSRLADLAAAKGRPYTNTRVRLSAQRLNAPGIDADPWPRGLPAPPRKETEDYKGDKARKIARLVPADGGRHVYRTPSGEHIALSWRYLLPHE
ncbi:hypothetical protein [Nonomuraea sp. GTA35]|uniref:hypothetical protein n=1 Tax=Nonomuraea sp. GTA35 TaxID=1676746 RepID=UPI0035C1D2C5